MIHLTDSGWLGWAAGIVDGEGCIRLARNKRANRPNDSWSIVVAVSNTDIAMLHKLKELLGGNIVKRSAPPMAHYKQQWRWQVFSKEAVAVLQKILPWLVTKHYQAECALLSCKYRGRGKTPSNMLQLEKLSQQMTDDKRVSHRTLQ